MRRMHRRRGERGAAAVEAALLTPLIFALVFGMIEMAFLVRDYVAVTSATRVGARQATAVESREDAQNCRTADNEDTVCAPRTVPLFAQVAATAMQQNGGAMPMENVLGIAVYKATDDALVEGPEALTDCSVDCVSFRWVPARNPTPEAPGTFRWARGSWDADTIDRCPISADQVGVKMFASHPSLTGLFGNVEVDDYAVMTFEPLKLEECAPTK